MSEDAQPEVMGTADILAEIEACRLSCAYFIWHYVLIEQKDDDGQGGTWRPFRLWDSQFDVLDELEASQLLAILKARQLGQTWLVLAWLLWKMLFQPGSACGVFSRREEEAIELLRRMRGIYGHLPPWLQSGSGGADAKKSWALANGSRALAFPTSAGDSYTFTAALVDEADLCTDLGQMLNSVKPTIDGGGKLVLLSKSDKKRPGSTFKRIYRQAGKAGSPWRRVFLPWSARPGRDAAWYAEQVAHSLDQDGSYDFVHENYPANPGEALSPSSGDKRFPTPILVGRYKPKDPILPAGAPVMPGLRLYREPVEGREYVIGGDPAEGLPTGDDSAAVVLDRLTGEEVATLAAKLEPKVAFGEALFEISIYFNSAAVLIERNNHGHAVLGYLETQHPEVPMLEGPDGRTGWPKTTPSKVEIANTAARALVDAAALIHDERTYTQVASIDARTLKHPDKNAKAVDDIADGWMLAQKARTLTVSPLWGGAYSELN